MRARRSTSVRRAAPPPTPGFSQACTPATSVSPSQSVTFANPGTYAVSLTVIDSSGNSDPNPPTRTITVLPATADFSISVVQAAQEVVPGGSATYTVSVTGLRGFSAPVTLSVGSESGFQTGITSGGFNPASISGAGPACAPGIRRATRPRSGRTGSRSRRDRLRLRDQRSRREIATPDRDDRHSVHRKR